MRLGRVAASAALLAIGGCLPQAEKPSIQVEGEATIAVPPDYFEVSAHVRARGDTHAQAVAALAKSFKKVQDDLPNLEGLTQLRLDASKVSVDPILDQQCAESDYNDYCPVTGVAAYISISVVGAPASKAGNAISLLSELGAAAVDLEGYGLWNPAKAQEEAVSAAVKAARKKADVIAAASGATIVGTARIQSGRNFDGSFFEMDSDRIVVTGSRIVLPKTALDIEPQPIEIDAEVVAAFTIE